MRRCATTAPTWGGARRPARPVLHRRRHPGLLAHDRAGNRPGGRLIDTIGTSAAVFGVVHGDLNPDNIIVAADGTVQFIDLAQLALAPYLWDVGVALYQYSYQDPSVRRALVAGSATLVPG